MQGFLEFTEEKKIVVKTKMGGEIPATIKVTGKDYHIVKTASGKQYKVDHQGNSLEEEIVAEDSMDPNAKPDKIDRKKEPNTRSERYYKNKEEKKKQGVAEETDKDLPFTPDVKKTKPSTPGKYGDAYSTVRNLARRALEKHKEKQVKEAEELEELNKSTLSSYVSKAAVDVYGKGLQRGSGDWKKSDGKKLVGRVLGIQKAAKKLAKEDLEEAAKTPAQKADFKRMMAGAMSRDDYNKKHKLGKYAEKSGKRKLDPTGVYHNLIKTNEEVELDEAIKLNSKVKIHAPGKDYHGEVGHVGEIRHGAYKGAPKTYTVDYGERKSVQLGKERIKLHKEEVELEEGKNYVGIIKAIHKLAKEETQEVNEMDYGNDDNSPPYDGHGYPKGGKPRGPDIYVKKAQKVKDVMKDAKKTLDKILGQQKEEVNLDEGKMGELHDTISRHLDKHISDFKSGHTGMDQFGSKVLAAHKSVAKEHGLEHKHAAKMVNDYVDSKLNEEVELDEAEQWELKRIHGEYKHLKSLSTAEVHAKHKAQHRITSKYTPAEVGGKQAMIDDIMHNRHGKNRMDAYHALPKKHKDALSESLEEGKDYTVTVNHYVRDGDKRTQTDHEYVVRNANDRRHAKHIAMQKHEKKVGPLKPGHSYGSSNMHVKELEETKKLSAAEKLDRGLKRGGYDSSAAADKIKEIQKKLADQEKRYKEQGTLKEDELEEDATTAEYKIKKYVGQDGKTHERKVRPHRIYFKNSKANATPETSVEVDDEDQKAKIKEEADAGDSKHRILVTLSNPNHTMVTQRKEKIQKHVRLSAASKEDAIKRAKAHYSKRGYKVHDAEHVGMIKEAIDKKAELRAALARHEQHAIEANKRGDDEAVKTHQNFINKIKTKMAKLASSE